MELSSWNPHAVWIFLLGRSLVSGAALLAVSPAQIAPPRPSPCESGSNPPAEALLELLSAKTTLALAALPWSPVNGQNGRPEI